MVHLWLLLTSTNERWQELGRDNYSCVYVFVHMYVCIPMTGCVCVCVCSISLPSCDLVMVEKLVSSTSLQSHMCCLYMVSFVKGSFMLGWLSCFEFLHQECYKSQQVGWYKDASLDHCVCSNHHSLCILLAHLQNVFSFFTSYCFSLVLAIRC